MAKLAILGHKTRGKEVIEILEMLGGKNENSCCGSVTSRIYFIDINGYIVRRSILNYIDYLQHTLEGFLKKYPHKVGDKVCFPDDLFTPFTINKMWWDENANELLCSFIEDDIAVPVNGLIAYKEESIDKTNKIIFDTNTQSCDIMNDMIKEEDMGNGIIYDEIDFNRCPAADKVHLILGNNYEIKEENGNYYVVRKKPKYPKTYEECCKVVNASPYVSLVYDKFDGQTYSYDIDNLHIYENIRKLKICRDAYWKIAGKEMGLSKPWEPAWNESSPKYTITVIEDKLVKNFSLTQNYILAFPTAEMRDAFYENFKDLIELCKEFL